MRPPPLLAATLLTLTALAGAGCGPDFDPYNRLTSLRVLAIRSDPPTPGPGEAAALSALVYARQDEPPTSFAWSWCPLAGPANQGYPCLVGAEQVQMLAEAGVTLPPFDLGNDATATLPHPVEPALLAALCSGTTGVLPMLPDCEGGFPVQIKLTVSSATRTVTAVRELRLRFDPASEPNQNPSIEGVQARQVEDLYVPITEQNALTLPRDEETDLRAVVPDSASEWYQGKDNELRPARVRERLVLTWFVESGDTGSQRTTFIAGEIALQDALANDWTPARTRDYDRDRARLLVVLRDDRGGVSWTEGTVMLGQDP